MIYSKVRQYINQIVLATDSEFLEHKDAFNTNNVPSNIFDKAFHVFYSVPSINRGQTVIDLSIDCTVTFYFKGFRCSQEALDFSMDLVGKVSRNCCKIENVNNFRETDDFPIQSCNPESQVPEPLENNDNAIIITLDLTARLFDVIC
jgi:hypothetical protein